MDYTLLTQVNESVVEHEHYEQLIEQTIDVLEFDRDQVIHTNEEYEQFLEQIKNRPLLEMNGERAGIARSGEMEWMRDVSKQKQQKDYGPRIGISKNKQVAPEEGQRVVMPGKGGIGQIVALDLEHNQIMIRDKAGREFVVKRDELAGPKQVGKFTTWMIAK